MDLQKVAQVYQKKYSLTSKRKRLLFLFSQWSLTSSEATIEGLEQCVKYVQS